MTISEVITALTKGEIKRINGFFSRSKEGERIAKLHKVAMMRIDPWNNDIMGFTTVDKITPKKRQVILELIKEYGAQDGVNVYFREHEDENYIGLTTEERNWDNESIIHIQYKSK